MLHNSKHETGKVLNTYLTYVDVFEFAPTYKIFLQTPLIFCKAGDGTKH